MAQRDLGSLSSLVEALFQRLLKGCLGELTKRKCKTRLLLQVHDELVFDLFRTEQDEVTALVEANMRDALPLDVPIAVQIGTGKNWLEAH